jgi:WD40 repeat protein
VPVCHGRNKEIIVSSSRDKTIRVWNALSGVCLNVFQGHTAPVRCIVFHGRYILSGSYDNNIRIWDPVDNPENECKDILRGHTDKVYSLTSNEQWVVSGSRDCTIKVWDFETCRCVHTLAIRGDVNPPHLQVLLTTSMALKGNILLSVNSDNYVRVWDVKEGKLIHKLAGHVYPVSFVSFYGEHAVSCSDDGTVKLWNLRSGELIRDIVKLNRDVPNSLGGGSAGADPEPHSRLASWRFLQSPCYLVLAAGAAAEEGHTEDSTKLYCMDFSEMLRDPGVPLPTPPRLSKDAEFRRRLGETP